MCVDPKDIPLVAIVDAELMLTMPNRTIAATGMDALTHAIEGYITKGAHIISDMFELKAVELIAKHLRGAVANKNLEDMEGMSIAQYIAGMGFSNVGLGIVHSMAHPLGAVYDIPHGVANALLLPTVMEFNMSACIDKYGDIVRVVKVDDFSIELCGGTHIDNIAKIGLFKIESESGVAAGVRRIEAVTGLGAYELVKRMERTLKEIAKTVKADEANVVERVEKMTETLRENSKEIESLKAKITNYEAGSLNDAAEEINGVKVVIKTFKDKTAEELRQMVDSLKDKLGSCVVVLASGEDKAIFAVGVTKDLIGKAKAGNLVKEAAQVAKVRETLKTLL